MNSKPPKPNSQVSIYMNLQNEMEIAEKYSNLPYTLKKLQDFTFSEIKFLVGGGVRTPPPPPTSTRQLTILLASTSFIGNSNFFICPLFTVFMLLIYEAIAAIFWQSASYVYFWVFRM